MKIHGNFSDIFIGIDCFKGIFKLQVREGSYPYQTLLRRVPSQESLQEELELLQKQQITVSLDIGEASEWCSSFLLVPKVDGKVSLCLGGPVEQSPDKANSQGSNP